MKAPKAFPTGVTNVFAATLFPATATRATKTIPRAIKMTPKDRIMVEVICSFMVAGSVVILFADAKFHSQVKHFWLGDGSIQRKSPDTPRGNAGAVALLRV